MKKSTRNFTIGILFILGLIIANHFGILDNIDLNDKSQIWYYNSQGFEFKNHPKYTYQGIIIAPPDTRIDHQKIKVQTTQLLEPLQQRIEGSVLVKTELYPPYQYGDLVEITSFDKETIKTKLSKAPGGMAKLLEMAFELTKYMAAVKSGSVQDIRIGGSGANSFSGMLAPLIALLSNKNGSTDSE